MHKTHKTLLCTYIFWKHRLYEMIERDSTSIKLENSHPDLIKDRTSSESNLCCSKWGGEGVADSPATRFHPDWTEPTPKCLSNCTEIGNHERSKLRT